MYIHSHFPILSFKIWCPSFFYYLSIHVCRGMLLNSEISLLMYLHSLAFSNYFHQNMISILYSFVFFYSLGIIKLKSWLVHAEIVVIPLITNHSSRLVFDSRFSFYHLFQNDAIIGTKWCHYWICSEFQCSN